jgi:homogentisate phytyltransferase/homogentisate geranylgeranyltransferase
VRTLSVRLGEGPVFGLCVALLSAAYLLAMGASLALPGEALYMNCIDVIHSITTGSMPGQGRLDRAAG